MAPLERCACWACLGVQSHYSLSPQGSSTWQRYQGLLNFKFKQKWERFPICVILASFTVCVLGFFYFCSGWLLSQVCFPAGIAFFFKRSYDFFFFNFPFLWPLVGLIKLKSNAMCTHQELPAAKAMLSLAGFPGESFLAEWFYELYNQIFVWWSLYMRSLQNERIVFYSSTSFSYNTKVFQSFMFSDLPCILLCMYAWILAWEFN